MLKKLMTPINTRTSLLLLAVLLVIVVMVLFDVWKSSRTAEVIIINASNQRISNVTISIPGAEVVISDLAPFDIVKAHAPCVGTPEGWAPSQHGRFADRTEIVSNGIRGSDGERIKHWVYIIQPDRTVYAKVNEPSAFKETGHVIIHP